MKFHEYRLTKNAGLLPPELAALSMLQCYYSIDYNLQRGWLPQDIGMLLCAEVGYVRNRRPFYNVYPAVTTCLANTKLDLELKHLPEQREVIAVCFAEGKEPLLHNGKLTAMLIEFRQKIRDFEQNKILDKPLLRIVYNRIKQDGTWAFSGLCLYEEGSISEVLKDREEEERRILFSLAVGILMLAQDERFVEPILLQQDQGLQLNVAELERARTRAKQRGRNGMTIGKGLEVSPHTRMPHFAIRWTGKEGAIPRLVPVKGCVVSRNKLFPVPTDYLDK